MQTTTWKLVKSLLDLSHHEEEEFEIEQNNHSDELTKNQD